MKVRADEEDALGDLQQLSQPGRTTDPRKELSISILIYMSTQQKIMMLSLHLLMNKAVLWNGIICLRLCATRKRSRAPDENGRERAEPEADDQNVDMEGRVPVPDADDQNVGVDGRVFPSTRSPGLLYSVARNKVSGSRFVTGQGSGDLFNAQTAPRSHVFQMPFLNRCLAKGLCRADASDVIFWQYKKPWFTRLAHVSERKAKSEHGDQAGLQTLFRQFADEVGRIHLDSIGERIEWHSEWIPALAILPMLVGTVHLQDSASSEAMSAASREQEKPTLGEVVDQIGLGPAQVRASLLGGGVWLADGAELLLIGSVADTLARSWQLSRFLKGFVVTVVYTGVMVGNISSGPLGAHLGRRELVIASYTGIFIFSILSSTSSTIAVLLVWRFIVGWSIGIGQPAWMAIAAEITPSSWRIVTGGFSQTMFAFGELYAAFLLMNDDPSLKHLNWRRVIQLGAIPSLILMALAIPFLQQSPTYLQLKGCHAEAIKVLESMRRDNRASDVSVDFRLPLNPTSSSTEGMLDMLWKQGKTILGAKLILPTMVVSFTCFELNLLYYGCIYAFPQVLSDLVAEGAAQQLLVGALWEIPGVCIGIALGIMYLRKTGIKFYLTLAASVTLLFIIGGNNRNRHWAFDIALYAGYYGIKLSPNIGFVLVYQVANEIYPAEARTLGCGLCLACGRLAAMLGPLLFEGLFELTGTWLTFFLIMAGFAVFNLYVVDVIPETANKILDDHRKPSK
ncbi:Synaptic vesicle 2-related protein [Symbiodinium microadriaticum]|uniref:Synaptic vesicle 2-related protein n=1 Tax=Symbiodinium microadriaticum TaxID=2951 RepID=A0A1Q9C606_SYMMI|nr:Synaptic vesicle 2-related protein [Symbiodinium microadriaticum]